MSVNNVNSAAGISFSQMQGMDIESMLMAVQGNRANLLEEQLMGEMKNVQAKNEQIATLNAKLTVLTGASQMAYASADAKPETGLSDAQKAAIAKLVPTATQEELEVKWTQKLNAHFSGTPLSDTDRAFAESAVTDWVNGYYSATQVHDLWLNPDYRKGEFNGVEFLNYKFNDPTASLYGNAKNKDSVVKNLAIAEKNNSPTFANKGELDKAITELKGQVDSLGSTQQMDMLRLQSLSNKRNEAFDLMTNFMKKFADKRDAIIGNMR